MKNQLTQGIKQMYEEAGQIGHTGMRRLLLDVQAALDAKDAEIAALKDGAAAGREHLTGTLFQIIDKKDAEIAALKARLEITPDQGISASAVKGITLKHMGRELDNKIAEIAALKADYLRACQTVAAMHEAATGRTGEAPWLGVVEDVAEVRKNAERYRWLSLQDLTYLSLGYIVDREHDGEYCVDMLDDTFYGETLGAAFDKAMAQAVQPTRVCHYESAAGRVCNKCGTIHGTLAKAVQLS